MPAKQLFKSAVKVVAFVLVLALAVSGVNRVLMNKSPHSTEPIQTLYAQPEGSIDVLFLGSSHVFANVNTGVLWDEQGIAAYDLGGSIQPLWNTYYYLKEALKTQRPKLIVLDVFRAEETEEYSEEVTAYQNIQGMDFSLDKIRAIAASSGDQRQDLLLGLPIYHSRYFEIVEEDFLGDAAIKDRSSWKGFAPYDNSRSLEENPDASNVATDEIPLSDKTQEYLVKIIELAKNEGIPLLLVNSPFPVNDEQQAMYNAVARIAAEYDVPYLSHTELFTVANLDFTGEETDLADSNHLNYRGGLKYSSYLGEYIKDHYDIPDRRGDDAYDSWQTDADNIRAWVGDHDILKIRGMDAWMKEVLSQGRFTLVVSFAKTEAVPEGVSAVVSNLEGKGLNASSVDFDEGFSVVLRGGSVAALSGGGGFSWHEKLFSDELMVKQNEDATTIRLGYSSYTAIENGVTVFLYDDLRGALVEVSSWSYDALDDKRDVEEA